jgi:hypothetical protein
MAPIDRRDQPMNRKISTTTRLVALLTCVALLHGCTTVQLNTNAPGSTLAIRGASEKNALPRTEDLGSKVTGQYEFVATPPQGEPVYGILPLKINAGKIVLAALFFAPALVIFGFRDPYNVYEFDPAAKGLRYRYAETDEWRTYTPTASETERAKTYFEGIARGCKVVNVNGKEVMDCPPAAAPVAAAASAAAK